MLEKRIRMLRVTRQLVYLVRVRVGVRVRVRVRVRVGVGVGVGVGVRVRVRVRVRRQLVYSARSFVVRVAVRAARRCAGSLAATLPAE